MDLLSPSHPALRDLEDFPALPLDKSVPSHVLNRRRHAISGTSDTPYSSKPRMKRRGAISYDHLDPCAIYIRYLGEALCQKHNLTVLSSIHQATALSKKEMATLCAAQSKGRRGSMRCVSSSSPVDPDQFLKGLLQESDIPAHIEQGNIGNVSSWDFDVFAFGRMTKGRPLLYLGLYLFHHHNLMETFQLDFMKLRKFLCLVEDSYHPENSYHNCTHASDVTQGLHCLISDSKFWDRTTDLYTGNLKKTLIYKPLLLTPVQQERLYRKKIYPALSPLEILTLLLAAICHDLDHPGVTTNYLVNTSSYLATLYGDKSVLEKHHCRSAKAALKESQLLDHLSEEQRLAISNLMEELILSTDVTRHKDFQTHFEQRLVSDSEIDLSNEADRNFIMMMAIKAADISNPARNLNLSKTWSENIMEEFFKQGDNERALKLPISNLCDRHTTVIPKAQSGFFEYVALPTFKAWSKFVGSPLSVRLCENIIRNKSYWDKQI